MSHHLAELNERSFAAQGDYESLLFEGTWHTSGSLFERGRRVAGGLREIGVGPDDRVVVLMMNTPEVFVTYQAVWRAGAVVTPVIFLQTPPELRHILEDSEATAAVVTPELLPLIQSAAEGLDLRILVVGEEADAPEGTTWYGELEKADPIEIVPRADDDLAALLYTGGTTGRSKGVMLTHGGLWASGAGINSVGETMGTTRSLLPLPLSHAYGLIVAVGGMHSDKQLVSVMQRWFDAPGWLALVAEHRLESSPIVPSMLSMILAEPIEDYDLSSLVSFGSGGAPLPDSLRTEVAERLGAVILEGYGLTESSAVVSASTPATIRAGSVGKPLPHADVAIVAPDGSRLPAGEDGEICVRGPGVMKGYWKSPEQTADTVVDGWLHTGDVGHLDDEGYLFVVDRLKDLIIRGGFNVYPRDVEDALMTHPGVIAAAVVGRPDAEKGEEVVAVVSVDPASGLDAEALIAYSRERLARHKYPREVVLVDAVPLTSVGKTDRKAVRALVRE
ncbi:MAG TPA: AMP-binding protein [Marmoricola sp.]|jgi:long-chain acyl-CoA synthetase|nr:AMP-binding protein [Marmoricola sp.]